MDRIWAALGSARAEIRSDVPEVLDVVRAALPRADGGGEADARITVSRTPGRSRFADEAGGNGEGVFRFEEGIVYRYDPERQRYSVTVRDAAWGEIDMAGCSATWLVARPMLPRSLLHSLVLDPLSLMLPLRGVLICHGAAVVAQDGATLLLGPSGSGKSTLTYLLSGGGIPGGLRPLTDDTMVLDFMGEAVRVFPIRSGFGLPESLHPGGSEADFGGPALQSSHGKVYVPKLPGTADGPHAVRRVAFLCKGASEEDRTELVPLGRAEARWHLLDGQSVIPSPGMVHRVGFMDRLALQASAVRVAYGERCDVGALRDFAAGAVSGMPFAGGGPGIWRCWN